MMNFFDTIKNIEIYVNNTQNALIECNYLKDYTKDLYYPKNLNLRIKEIITPYGEILDSASPNLRIIRNGIKETEKAIQSKLQEILSKSSSKLSQATISIRDDRYVIPVKNDFKSSIKGIIHGESASGETVYVEPIVVCNLNNKLNSLKEDEQREIYNILREVSLSISEISDELEKSYLIIEQLDMIFGKAGLSNKLNCCKPKVNKNGIVNLLDCYHPLLNVEKVVSNNIAIGKDYKGIIITGPNTGGKTVLLKTVGLLSLMVKFGLLIPCNENSEIMIFDDVFADIGDEQSIDQNLSTFSSHLKNVIDIMNNVDENSLVLVDELGSGTDPSEGSALAISIFDYLINKKCLVIASSHYAELKIHAYQANNVINASVEFDIKTLKPTYKLLIGVPGESNALKICRSLGLHSEIIEKAEGYASQNNNEINLTLEKLVKRSHELAKELELSRLQNKELKEKIIKLDEEIERTYKEREDILRKAEIDSRKILENNQNRIDELIAELSEMKLRNGKEHEIAYVKHKYRDMKENSYVDIPVLLEKSEIEEKDKVLVITYNCYGEVVKKLKGDKYLIQMGNATITTSKDNLKLVKDNKIESSFVSSKTKPINVDIKKKSVSMRLDLRGMRYEEAAPLIDDYIYDAVYAGFQQVSIIHGFGTGVIRELVHKKLKNNSEVESFRYGGQNEGGQGATIVVLKK